MQHAIFLSYIFEHILPHTVTQSCFWRYSRDRPNSFKQLCVLIKKLEVFCVCNFCFSLVIGHCFLVPNNLNTNHFGRDKNIENHPAGAWDRIAFSELTIITCHFLLVNTLWLRLVWTHGRHSIKLTLIIMLHGTSTKWGSLWGSCWRDLRASLKLWRCET